MSARRPEPKVDVHLVSSRNLRTSRDCIVIVVYPSGYASVYKVTYLPSFGRRLCVVQEEFSFNSLYPVALSDVLVMASLLRTVPGALKAAPIHLRELSGLLDLFSAAESLGET